jgi:hypothetical protein
MGCEDGGRGDRGTHGRRGVRKARQQLEFQDPGPPVEVHQLQSAGLARGRNARSRLCSDETPAAEESGARTCGGARHAGALYEDLGRMSIGEQRLLVGAGTTTGHTEADPDQRRAAHGPSRHPCHGGAAVTPHAPQPCRWTAGACTGFDHGRNPSTLRVPAWVPGDCARVTSAGGRRHARRGDGPR